MDITNAEATREALEDRRRLEEFFRANFFNPDESFRRAFRTFDSDAGFRDLVEGQLRKLLNRRISAEKRAAAGAAEWRGSPYRPDGPYAQADARIFTGREAETRDLLARLPGRSFLLLSGASGSGKTSLIRAGLLSRLERPFLLEGVAGCRIALVDPSPGADPATDSPAGPLAALAAGLCTPQALGPTLAGFGVTPEGLAHLLARDPGAAAAQVGAALTALARDRKGHTGMAEGELRLALVLDPLDALLAACAERGPIACAGLVAAAAALASGGRTWVIGVVGTARLGLLAPLLPLLAVSDRDGVPGLDPDAWYHLEAPAPGRVRQVVEIPARVAGVEVEGHAPGDRRSLVDLLEAEAGTLRHWPPLVEAALDLAYRRAAERARTQPQGAAGATLTRADYQAVGGIAGVVLARAEAVWAGLDAGVRSALPVLCRALISLDGARPGLRSGDLRVLEADPACRALVAALVEARLVAVDAERDHLTGSPCPQADYSLLAEVRETLRQTWAGWRARLRPKRAAAALTAELAPELAAGPTAAAAAPAAGQSGPAAEAEPAVPDDLTDWAAWRAGASFTHPVLLTGWSPVRDWLARPDNRQTLQLRHQIGRRAQLWRRTDCNREYLLGAAGYPAAKALAATLAGEIEPLEADYLAQSALYLGLQRRRSQALRAIGATLLVLLALATWAALWALDASHFGPDPAASQRTGRRRHRYRQGQFPPGPDAGPGRRPRPTSGGQRYRQPGADGKPAHRHGPGRPGRRPWARGAAHLAGLPRRRRTPGHGHPGGGRLPLAPGGGALRAGGSAGRSRA